MKCTFEPSPLNPDHIRVKCPSFDGFVDFDNDNNPTRIHSKVPAERVAEYLAALEAYTLDAQTALANVHILPSDIYPTKPAHKFAYRTAEEAWENEDESAWFDMKNAGL